MILWCSGKPYSSSLYIDDKACLNNVAEIKRRIAAINTGTEAEYIEQQNQYLTRMYGILDGIAKLADVQPMPVHLFKTMWDASDNDK